MVLGIAQLAEEGDLALDLANVLVVRMIEINDLRVCAYRESAPCSSSVANRQASSPRPAP